MKINGVNFNFDRIVRLKVYYGGNSCVVEFAPLADPRLNARIEAEVQDLPIPNKKNKLPGFTGKITIYNPSDELRRILANNITWPIDFASSPQAFEREMKEAVGHTDDTTGAQTAATQATANGGQKNLLQKYYDNRVRASLEVGYWDHDAPAPTGKQKVTTEDNQKGLTGDPRRKYSMLVDGYVNNSIYYNKGRDNILEITVHDFSYEEQDLSAIRSAAGLVITDKQKDQFEKWSLQERQKRSGRNVLTWDNMLSKLVMNFATYRPLNPQETTANLMSYPTYVVPTEKDRQNAGSWIRIKYIFKPSDKKTENVELYNKLAKEFTNIKNFYTLANDLPGMINELATYKDANVEWERDDIYNQGFITIFVWPKGAGYETVAGHQADIQIVNYQNLLESPGADSSGSLYIRMFLNLEAKPMRNIALILRTTDAEGKERTDRGGITDQLTMNPMKTNIGNNLSSRYYYESISFHGSPSPYWPAIQGANANAVYALQYGRGEATGKGYLFNTGFPIVTATHKISTHGPEWETSVKTIPMYTGIKLGTKAGA